jgi:hypothetical protein
MTVTAAPGEHGAAAPARRRSPLARLLLAVLTGYRTAISPLRPPACRFTPTCSAYAVEAITVHGAARGSRLAVRRLARCHPWHRGGHDPVPLHVDAQEPVTPSLPSPAAQPRSS